MRINEPACGHSSLKPHCHECEKFRRKWYAKVEAKDPSWKDIEYGLEHPDRLYEPVDVSKVDPIATEYYDRVLDVLHQWVKSGRSKRDCLVAELLGLQAGDSGTERGIALALKRKRLKPNSRFTVRETIKEISELVLKIAQRHPGVEQLGSPDLLSPQAAKLYLLDSKPLKDEANGKPKKAPARRSDPHAA